MKTATVKPIVNRSSSPWLQCFGAPALRGRSIDGEETVLLPAGKPLLVLALLAIRYPAAVSREELALVGWGHRDEIHAKASLRQALYRIRRALGSDAIVTNDKSARLVHPLPGDWPLMNAAAAADNDLDLIRSMTGGFLENIERDDREEPGDWLRAERTRWALLAHAAALRAGRRALAVGDVESAVSLAKRTLATDDEKLAGWALYLEALRATESPSRLESGLAQFEAAGQHQLLAAVDQASWHRLEQQNRRALEELRSDVGGDTAALLDGELPFTGRAGLLDHLLMQLTRPAGRRHRTIAMIAGPGFGKTRMLRELRVRLAGRPVTVAQVEAIAAEAASPWALLNRVVEILTGLPGAMGIDPRSAANLVALNPRLQERFSGAMPAPRALPEAEVLATALAELLAAVADARPLVLLIDDLHWGDERSVTVLLAALQQTVSINVHCLATTRDAAARQFRDCHTLHLPSLTAEAVEALIATSLPAISASQRPSAAKAMLLLTGGVPHYVALAMQRLLAMVPIAEHEGEDLGSQMLAAIPSLELYWDPAMPTTGDGRNILEYLVIVDEPIGLDELQSILGIRERHDLEVTLATLQRQRSITIGTAGVALSHDLVLQQIVEGLPDGRYRLLSLQRARWLAEHGRALHELQSAVRRNLAYGLTFQAAAAVRTWCRRWPNSARGSALADLLLPPFYTRRLRWQLIAAATPAPLWRLALAGGLLLLAAWAGMSWLTYPVDLRPENTPRVQPTQEGVVVVRNMEPPEFTVRDRLGRISTSLDGESLRVVGRSSSVDSLHLNPLPVIRNGRVSADSLVVFTHAMDSLQITFQAGDLQPHTLTVFRGYGAQSLALVGGRINGTIIDSVRPELTVGPGDSLLGTVLLRYTTPAQAALWMLAESSTMGVLSEDTSTVMTLHTGAARAIAEIRITRRAPTRPGQYWLLWTFGAEPSAAWILSLTNWRCGTPHWNDHNNLLAVPDSMLEHAWGGGFLAGRREICDDPRHPTWQPMRYPTATMRVTVRAGN